MTTACVMAGPCRLLLDEVGTGDDDDPGTVSDQAHLRGHPPDRSGGQPERAGHLVGTVVLRGGGVDHAVLHVLTRSGTDQPEREPCRAQAALTLALGSQSEREQPGKLRRLAVPLLPSTDIAAPGIGGAIAVILVIVMLGLSASYIRRTLKADEA